MSDHAMTGFLEAVKSLSWFLVAVAGFVVSGVCYVIHVCMDGHMRHPPYSWLDHGLDVLWLIGAAAVAVAAWISRARHRIVISALVLGTVASRLEPVNALRGLAQLDPLLWVALLILCWRSFGRSFRGNVSPP